MFYKFHIFSSLIFIIKVDILVFSINLRGPFRKPHVSEKVSSIKIIIIIAFTLRNGSIVTEIVN